MLPGAVSGWHLPFSIWYDEAAMLTIEAHGLTKTFRSGAFPRRATTALREVSLAIPKGVIFGLLGPNGAGKTTLLRILAGLEQPSAGAVTYRGHLVTPEVIPRLRQEVSLVHQSPLLFDTTVFENLSFGLRIRKIAKAEREQRVTEALAMVGLSQLEKDRRARGLSGGEVQRVAIARALALEPAILLLDEPFANVDQATVKALEDLFRKIGAGGRTLIFSTHNPSLAHRLAREVVVLREGRLSPSPAPPAPATASAPPAAPPAAAGILVCTRPLVR